MLAHGSTALMKPAQVQEAKEELAHIDATLNAPPHIRSRISDPRGMQKRRQALKAQLERHAPRPYRQDELDAAIKEYNALADFIAKDMPSSAVMRRNPAGAVGQHLSWEKRTETAVQRWKYIGLRLLATGAVPDHLKHSTDVSNVERLRQLDGPTDEMDGAQIPKIRDYHFGADVANSVIFSDEEIQIANVLGPDIAGQLALMTNDQREIVKRTIADILKPPTPFADDSPFAEVVREAGRLGIKTFGRKREDIIADIREREAKA